MNEHAKSSHPLPIDETVRTRDELAEILTLVQTGTSRRIPILLVQRGFWDGIIHGSGPPWGARVPSMRPLELFEVVDNPQKVVDAIFKYYEHRPRPLGRGTRDLPAPMSPSSVDRKAASIRRATALLAWAPCAALAQTEAPQNLEPVPDVPPPPARVESGEPLEPDVRIIRKKDATIEEYRINGNLYMIKVIPVIGPPYYLMDQDGDGRMETNMSELRENFVVPQWVLFSW